MFCANCGKKINPNEKFCPNCGVSVHVDENFEAPLNSLMEEPSQEEPVQNEQKSESSTSYWGNMYTGGNFILMSNLSSWVIVVGMVVSLIDLWFDWNIFNNVTLVMTVLAVYSDYRLLKERSELTGQKLTGAWMAWCVVLLPVYLWKKATKTGQSHAAAIVATIIAILMVALCAYVWYYMMMLAIYD